MTKTKQEIMDEVISTLGMENPWTVWFCIICERHDSMPIVRWAQDIALTSWRGKIGTRYENIRFGDADLLNIETEDLEEKGYSDFEVAIDAYLREERGTERTFEEWLESKPNKKQV